LMKCRMNKGKRERDQGVSPFPPKGFRQAQQDKKKKVQTASRTQHTEKSHLWVKKRRHGLSHTKGRVDSENRKHSGWENKENIKKAGKKTNKKRKPT